MNNIRDKMDKGFTKSLRDNYNDSINMGKEYLNATLSEKKKLEKAIIEKKKKFKQLRKDPGKKVTPFFSNMASIISYRLGLFLINFFKIFIYIDSLYIRSLIVMYIPRILFAIMLIVIIIAYHTGSSLNSSNLYWLYSAVKLTYTIMVVIATFFVISKISAIVLARKDFNIPLHLLVGLMMAFMVPYMYDLTAIIMLVGIIRAYYELQCVGEGTSEITYWFGITWIIGIFYIIMGSIFILNIITFRKNKDKDTSLKKNSFAKSLTIALCGSFIFMKTIASLEGMEKFISKKIINVINGTSSGSCPSSDNDTDDPSIIDWLQFILICIIFAAVLCIQMIPFYGLANFNTQIRILLGEKVDFIINNILPKSDENPLATEDV